MMTDKESRVILKPDRIKHWQSVGALVSEKVTVLMNKYMKKFEDAAIQVQAQAPAPEGAPV